MDIDRGTVEAVARRAVGDPAATLLEWSSVELGAGASAELGKSGGLRRVMGTVAVERGEQPWSAIAKTLRDHEIEVGDAHPDVNDTHGIEYWRREVEAYESGVLDDLDDGIGAPRRYHIEDLDREAIVWMEDVPDEHHAGWPLDRYWMAARDLGVFNGRFAGAVPAAAAGCDLAGDAVTDCPAAARRSCSFFSISALRAAKRSASAISAALRAAARRSSRSASNCAVPAASITWGSSSA